VQKRFHPDGMGEDTKDVVFVRPKKQVISLRLEPQVINKLKELADKEGLPPTTYARMLIIRDDLNHQNYLKNPT
jgi:predicted DNA binding CopG/RHH family protein